MGNLLWSKRYNPRLGRNRAKRPKTFKTEEVAHAWAKKQGIKKYHLENLRPHCAKRKKIRVVPG